MTQSNIQNLREALEHSPGNTPLRLMLADALFEANEFLDAEKLTGKAYVLTARHRLLGDARALADQVWDLTRINFNYLDISEKLERPNFKLTKVYQQYLNVLSIDPCLPGELLPDNWCGEKLREKLTHHFQATIGG